MPKPSPKVNTIFSYFTKTPKKSSDNLDSKESEKQNDSCSQINSPQITKITNGKQPQPPKQSKSLKSLINSPKSSASKRKSPSKTKEPKVKKATSDFDFFDVVWAKLDGYPWWPAMVCNHPTLGTHFQPRDAILHVQFFDDPITRAWVKHRSVKDFAANKYTMAKLKDPKWKAGVQEAEKALAIDKSERNKLLVAVTGDDEKMELDDEEDSAEEMAEDVEEEDSEDAKENVSPCFSSLKPKAKRRRIMSESEESEGSNFEPEVSGSESDSASSGVAEASEPEPESEPESPVKPQKRPQKRKISSAPTLSMFSHKTPTSTSAKTSAKTPTSTPAKTPTSTPAKTLSKTLTLTPAKMAQEEGSSPSESKIWTHLTLSWLKPENIRDKKGRAPSHPDYDPHTLFVPESFMKSLTPGLRQWWLLKATHYDTILFFKVGKFYELYHMDAVIGVQELGLTFMKGDFAHSGFPEIGYSRFSPLLIQKGYKVARVEQTETPQMMEERCKKLAKPTKFDRVVNREICRITSRGTQTFSVLDGDPPEPSNAFLFALTEKGYDDATGGESEYGVCFIDTSIGKFHLGQFQDDRHCSKLRTLVAHYPPVQVLHEKGVISQKTQTLLRSALSSAQKEALRTGAQFWEAATTLSFLAEKEYFSGTWPASLTELVDDGESAQRKPKEGSELALRALGACLWYLRDCCIVDEVLSMKNFEVYRPVEQLASSAGTLPSTIQHMVLDGVALVNLEVLENSVTGSQEGTLLGTMDFCATPFGKRLFRQWLCSPLFQPAAIVERQDAVEEMSRNPELVSELVKTLVKLPDLERLLSRIHSQGCAATAEDHPDSRAIFYELDKYSRRKINDFITVLQGFSFAQDLVNKQLPSFSSSLLQQGIVEQFPDLTEQLEFFRNAFDHEKAKKDGKIIPTKGVDTEYDKAQEDIKKYKKQLEEYLEGQKEAFKCRQVVYYSSGRNRYQLEVPESACHRATDEHDLQGQRKGFRRYWTEDIKALLSELTSAEELQENALKDIMRRIFEIFDKDYAQWEKAVSCLATLDCLVSMAQYNTTSTVPMCRPEVVPPVANKPFLELKEARHPTLVKLFSGDDLIPNDILICSQDEANLVLVTGPNMGGKSTLMRQAGLLVIMAQLGSFVPANTCRFSPADRIFTRLGASDKIMAGESTFFIEVSETASILKYATPHSLVLLDELGRGTSTYDGAGIASAVVSDLAEHLHCRTLFSTHYHSLVEQFTSSPRVKLGHMACMVEKEDHPTEETITFLYKFVDGDCPKSYGFNAARLAGMPNQIVTKAREKARQLEDVVSARKMFRSLINCEDPLKLSQLVSLAA